MNIFVHVYLQTCARFPEGRYLEVKMQDHMVCKYSILLNITILPSCVTVPIYILKSSCFSAPLTTLGVIRCLMVSHSHNHLLLIVGWFAFLMLWKMSIFSCLSAWGVFWRWPVHILCPFFLISCFIIFFSFVALQIFLYILSTSNL